MDDLAKCVSFQQSLITNLVVVVNMFLTGFDSKKLNTLYVDKNLRFHGLIQAFSRTNRILNEVKSQGNIVCFRNLKSATDEAITLFSNINSKDEIVIEPYENYVEKFNQAFIELLKITPTVNSVSNLPSEEEEAEFIKAFRELMRLKNVLTTFTEFHFDDLAMGAQLFEDYKSKYLDLYDKTRKNNETQKTSILDDIDFELELIHRDEINVSYILKLLAKLKDATPAEQEKQKKALIEIIAGDAELRSKRELIEKFVQENLPNVNDSDQVPEAFDLYWNEERKLALKKLSEEENLETDKLEDIIGKYIYTEKIPLRDDVVSMIKLRPSLKERSSVAERISS
ncbi:MAG: hypothetical protein EOO19_13050 [Chryseobacterium sp.]|nr:MAG: hypothetical protein EOO19_13050 [Chryseobacterium sp.]